jgi:hypothetical protein
VFIPRHHLGRGFVDSFDRYGPFVRRSSSIEDPTAERLDEKGLASAQFDDPVARLQ